MPVQRGKRARPGRSDTDGAATCLEPLLLWERTRTPTADANPSEPRPCAAARRTQLRNKFKTNGQFYRVFPNGEVQYLHPKDGVFPEKVNEGRPMVGHNPRRIGANPNPANLKFTGKNSFDA